MPSRLSPSLPNCPPASGLMRSLLVLQPRRLPPDFVGAPPRGLTLIECIVAMVIITITVVAITPPIMLATATRIQTRRSEQANQIAQGEIDRLRSLLERGQVAGTTALRPYVANDLPAVSTAVNLKDTAAASSVTGTPLLTSAANCTDERYPTATPLLITQLVRVDIDNDCNPEFIMQVFRNAGVTGDAGGVDQPVGFVLGVRVYSYIGGEGETTLPPLGTEVASKAFTTGRRDTKGDGTLSARVRQPLAAMFTPVARSRSSSSLQQICNLANPTASGGTNPCTNY
jgi:prepilin-type N-terminal cleavage/methylation domain-containing protein